MTTPSQSSVTPADKETVQALAEVAYGAFVNGEDPARLADASPWDRGHWASIALAVIASEPWQQMVRERDEARAAVADAWALVHDGGHAIDCSYMTLGEAPCDCWLADLRAALSGGAGEQDEAEGCGCADVPPYGFVPEAGCPTHDKEGMA